MRIHKLAAATVRMVAVVSPGFGQPLPRVDLRVSVYMDYQADGDLSVGNLSKAIASRIFRSVRVTLMWVNSRSCPPDGILISLTGNTSANLHPGAQAHATPFEGAHTRIFQDRIHAGKPALAPHLLAHVLVHELIQILEGCTWQSGRGARNA